MKNKIIWIKINNHDYYKTLLKLNTLGITIYDSKLEKEDILIKTNIKDYEKIKKYLISYDSSIYSLSGILRIKELIKKYQVFLFSLILVFILLLVINNIVFKIDIKTNNLNIKKVINNELKNNGLRTFRFKKRHKDIEKIVNNILENNKDTLEWLEIKYDGMIMNVYVTEKSIINKDSNYNYCHIVSVTDAKILSLNLYRGVALKEINDYVKKGEVILSGDITFNNEIKNRVCAKGEVYGEVWYKVKVELPFKEEYIKYTGKERYNFNIKINDNKYRILKSRIDNKKEEEINLYKLNDFEINLVKEKEYINSSHILTEDEAYNKALQLVSDNIKLKLAKDEEILLKKVLKKEVNDSKIYLEVFVITKENIGMIKVQEEEINDGNTYP